MARYFYQLTAQNPVASDLFQFETAAGLPRAVSLSGLAGAIAPFLPDIPGPNDYVATSGNQTGLSGNKTWTGTHNFAAVTTNTLSAAGGGPDSLVAVNGATDNSRWIRFRKGGSGPNNNAGTVYSSYASNHIFVYNDGSLRFAYSSEAEGPTTPSWGSSSVFMTLSPSTFSYSGTLDLSGDINASIAFANSFRSASGTGDLCGATTNSGIRLMPNGFSTSNMTDIAGNGDMTVRGNLTSAGLDTTAGTNIIGNFRLTSSGAVNYIQAGTSRSTSSWGELRFGPYGSTSYHMRITAAGDTEVSGGLNLSGHSTSWGTTPSTGLRVSQGTSSGATWLISGVSGSTHRGGWQHLDNGNGFRLYAGSDFVFFSSGTLSASNIADSFGNVRKLDFRTANGTITLAGSDLNRVVEKSNNSSYTYTIPASHGSQGDAITFVNSGTGGNITINRATGVTLYRNGTNANITVGPGSMLTIYRSATANRWIA